MAAQAEVAAKLRDAVAEMQSLGFVGDNSGEADNEETEMNRCSFEPSNRNIEEPKDMNEYVLSYFESLNNMNRRIIAVQREAMADNKGRWKDLTSEEQDRVIDDYMVHPAIRKKYEDSEHRDDKKLAWFPVLKLAHGVSASSTDINQTHRDSITSVSDFFCKDQFSAPWSWETQSQQDLRFLQEGELEAEINKAIEEQSKKPDVRARILRRKASYGFDLESTGSSQSGSAVGSALNLRRKAYLDGDFDSHGASSASSVQGSKGSLNIQGSKASLSSGRLDTPELPAPKEEEHTPPPDASKTENLESESPQMGAQSNDFMEFLQNW